MKYIIIAITLIGTLLLPSQGWTQSGDSKEKNKNLLESTNWRKWAPDPVPFLTGEESLKTFQIAPGFRIELVAEAPMIKDPVFAEFDLKGRLWVCEFQTYMKDLDGSGENEADSRVMVLEDTDGDGKMDKSTVFLDDVINPRSLTIVEGGALVAAGDGKLLFCEDTDGDLKADKRTPILDFATAASGNIEHAENGLHYAIDNWMYNSKSSRRLKWQGGQIITSDTKGRGQWGMSTDAYGRLFYNTNSSWFSGDSEIYDRQFPGAKAPGRNVRAIRTNTALNRAYNPGMIKEDGRIDGVTSISGLAVHSNGAFGEEWEGVIFSFSPGTNTVGAFRPDKPMPETTKYEQLHYPAGKWEKREFLASTDERFRPVNGSFGPDGCLYIVDLNRGVIQHKKFLTSYLRRQSEERELDQHIGKGRIWRVVPEKHEKVPAPDSYIAGLQHPYLWWRLNTQKRIVEAQKKDLIPEITELAMNGSPRARAHAMWTLSGLGGIPKEAVETNLAHDDWFVQMTALRLASDATPLTVFPKDFVTQAEELSKSENKVVASYAGTLATKGYPNRFASIYKDKMPDWVKKDKALKGSYERGLVTYSQYCAACHQPHGKGLASVAPSLVNSDWVIKDYHVLLGVAMHGVSGPIHVNGKLIDNVPPIMPPHSFLTDDQMSDTLTYVRSAWGNKADPVSPAQVKEYRAKHKDRFAPWTEAELRK